MTKQYLSENTELMKEWDWEANADLDPHTLTFSSRIEAQWKCSKCGYKWRTRICNRTHQHTGCPACAGSILLVGKNDLLSKYPEIAKEWNYERNIDILPQNIRPGTHKKYWWKCSRCGHEWQASPNNRTNHNSKCPVCTHSSSHIRGKTDLATTHPELVKEWHPTKNKNLTPNELKSGSSKKVWWLCPVCKKDWQASVYSRIKGGNCPHCWHTNHTSFPEQAIFYYIKKVFPDAISRYKAPFLGRMELDIFIPKYSIGIEYDGEMWHKVEKENAEKRKYNVCKKNGIHLIRFKEGKKRDYSELADECYFISGKAKNNDLLERCITYVLNSLDFSYEKLFGNKIYLKSYDVDIKRDEIKIREQYQGKIEDSFAELYPEVAKDWHPTKNGLLKPENFYAGSEYLAWWQCSKCGYEWQTMIKQRTGKKLHNCPQCSHQTIVIGKNDLATTHPQLAAEWHPTKNGNLTPSNVITGFGKKYWWKCSKCGYEWQATIVHRKFSKSGCPLCANKVLISGLNDLKTKAPNIAKEWDYEKNAPLKPEEVHAGSNKKVWWICSVCGKSWQAAINSRVHYNHDGCRSCNHTLSRLRIKPKHKTNHFNKDQLDFNF